MTATSARSTARRPRRGSTGAARCASRSTATRCGSSRRSSGRPPTRAQGDIEAERARLQKEIDRAEKMLANEKFVANADPVAVQGEREKLAQYLAERDALA